MQTIAYVGTAVQLYVFKKVWGTGTKIQDVWSQTFPKRTVSWFVF